MTDEKKIEILMASATRIHAAGISETVAMRHAKNLFEHAEKVIHEWKAKEFAETR